MDWDKEMSRQQVNAKAKLEAAKQNPDRTAAEVAYRLGYLDAIRDIRIAVETEDGYGSKGRT